MFILVVYVGPTRRFRRVCEKLQAAIVNPSAINPLTLEMTDFSVNPSISSDDAITPVTTSPILTSNEEEDPVITKTNGDRAVTLLANYDSSDDCSEDGASILDH